MKAKKRLRKSGMAPGSLVYTGAAAAASDAKITLFDFDEQHCTEKTLDRIEQSLPFANASSVTWINVDALQMPGVLEASGKTLGLHPLVLEDILNTEQRPKYEDYGDYIYIVIKMLDIEGAESQITIEQLSLVIGANYVISFQERPGDVFNPLRERIRKGIGRIRKLRPDYTAYAILDAVVDRYFDVIDFIGEKIEALENELASNPKPDTLRRIHDLRRELIFVRKSVWPLREVIASMQRTDSDLIHQSTSIYLRDLYDHVVRTTDSVDSYRDMLSGMQDVYLSSISNRTNEVVKVLTLFSSIFLPLTFITGLFGMNFHNFPELDWKYGFQGTLLFMLVLFVLMLVFFKRKKWI
ncbi:MAG: magnesium/cobalt transporter CorA [Burkholderiales bacterium]